jgi:hypothetical protein
MVKHVLLHLDDDVHQRAKKLLEEQHWTWNQLINELVK